MRNRLQTFLKRKGLNKSNKTMELVGCSKDFLREHLEKQFKPGAWLFMFAVKSFFICREIFPLMLYLQYVALAQVF